MRFIPKDSDPKPPSDLLTIPECAKRLGLTRKDIQQAVRVRTIRQYVAPVPTKTVSLSEVREWRAELARRRKGRK